MALILFISSLMFFLFLGLPIYIVLICCSLVLMVGMGFYNPQILSTVMIDGANTFIMMSIPFFMFAGEIMQHGGLSKRIVEFANLIVGRFRGGLGYAAVLACIFFAGLSGSSMAGLAAVGAIIIPMMQEKGYDKEHSTGIVATSVILAPIIPPSGLFIVIGGMVNLSISKLFIGGLVPGLLIGLGLMIAWKIVVSKNKDNYGAIVIYSKKEAIKICKDSLPAIFMPIIIIGGIRFGIFTPTEAGAVAVMYAILICAFWYKELDWKKLKFIAYQSVKSTSKIMLIICSAKVVGWFLTYAKIPQQIAELLSVFIERPFLLLIMLNLFLFLMGMIMDVTANIIILTPILYPLIGAANIDPYYFTIIFVLNICIGQITPPFGNCLFLGSSIGNVNYIDLLRKNNPFFITMLIMLILFVIFPQLISWPMNFLS